MYFLLTDTDTTTLHKWRPVEGKTETREKKQQPKTVKAATNHRQGQETRELKYGGEGRQRCESRRQARKLEETTFLWT